MLFEILLADIKFQYNDLLVAAPDYAIRILHVTLLSKHDTWNEGTCLSTGQYCDRGGIYLFNRSAMIHQHCI